MTQVSTYKAKLNYILNTSLTNETTKGTKVSENLFIKPRYVLIGKLMHTMHFHSIGYTFTLFLNACKFLSMFCLPFSINLFSSFLPVYWRHHSHMHYIFVFIMQPVDI